MSFLGNLLCARLMVVALIVGAVAPRLQAQESTGSVLAGTVVDAVTKEPIAGVRISAGKGGFVPDWATTTGDLGEFAFHRLSPGPYHLTVQHPLYLPESGRPSDPVHVVSVTDDGPATDLVLTLARRPIISGTVRDEAGEPLVDVEVIAFRRLGHGGLEPDQFVRTDDRGAYRVVLSVPADYVIRVRGNTSRSPRPSGPPGPQPRAALGYPTVFFPGALRPSGAQPVRARLNEEKTGIDFALSPARGVSVSGTIAGVETVPFGLLPLTLFPLDGAEIPWDLPVASVRVGPDGRFAFANVPPGTYVLWALVFPQHKDGPTPTLHGPASPSSSGVIRTVGRGGSATGPPPDGDTLWIRTPVIVDADDLEMALSLNRGARLSGRVVFDGASPKPTSEELEGAVVQIFAADGMDLGPVPIGNLGGDGRFQVVGLPPGAYEFVLSRRGLASWGERSFEIGGRDVGGRPIQIGSDDIQDVAWTFTDRRTRIVGQLTDRQGRAVSGADVAVFPSDRSQWHRGLMTRTASVANTARDGEFALSVRGAGEYYVVAVPPSLRDRASDQNDPAVLDELSGLATIVRLEEGEQVSVRLVAAPEE
jgi:hypothetical protein